MKIIDRYILRSVLMGTLVAMLVLLPLIAFLLLADELDHVGTGRYTLGDAFTFIGLSLPRYAFQLFPIAALIGSLLGLGNLASHSELVAMRVAGISVARIVAAVLKGGLVLALLAALLGEGVAPISEERGKQLRAEALAEQIALKSRYGFWARDGGAFINIRLIRPGGRLEDVYIYELDRDKRLKLSTFAASAQYDGKAWTLRGIRQSEMSETGVRTRLLEQATWESLLDPAMLSLLIVDPHVLPVWGLHRYIGFLRENGLSTAVYEVAMWSKVVTPLLIFAMIFLSVPLLFGALRGVGLGQRVFVGVLIGIGFFILNKAVSQLPVVYDVNPLFAALLPTLVCLAAAVLFFRRVR